MNDQQFAIIKLHKSWADHYTVIWQIIALGVLGGIYFLMPQLGVAPSERTNGMILLLAIVTVSAVWQAAGLAIARIHMIVRGISLESRPESGRNG